MKRNRLVEAIAGTFFIAASAHAVSLSPNGIGGVLFYPYYTVNKGQDTLLSLVNSDRVNGKVVKVRFKEGYNGRVVMDLDVFLSPANVWTANPGMVVSRPRIRRRRPLFLGGRLTGFRAAGDRFHGLRHRQCECATRPVGQLQRPVRASKLRRRLHFCHPESVYADRNGDHRAPCATMTAAIANAA